MEILRTVVGWFSRPRRLRPPEASIARMSGRTLLQRCECSSLSFDLSQHVLAQREHELRARATEPTSLLEEEVRCHTLGFAAQVSFPG